MSSLATGETCELPGVDMNIVMGISLASVSRWTLSLTLQSLFIFPHFLSSQASHRAQGAWLRSAVWKLLVQEMPSYHSRGEAEFSDGLVQAV